MEASDVVEPGEGQSADGSEVAVGATSAAEAGLDDHQPLGAEDEHGTVTPRSAPPAGPQLGIDPGTGQPTVPPEGDEGDEGDTGHGD